MIRIPLRWLPLRLQRLAYRSAHAVLRAWWMIARPVSHGASVALWDGKSLLLIRTSYRPLLDLPGGGVEVNESTAEAARRELLEETGISLPASALGAPVESRFRYEHRAITSTVFTARLQDPVPLRIDGAEIIWAGFCEIEGLSAGELAPGLLAYLQDTGHHFS